MYFAKTEYTSLLPENIVIIELESKVNATFRLRAKSETFRSFKGSTSKITTCLRSAFLVTAASGLSGFNAARINSAFAEDSRNASITTSSSFSVCKIDSTASCGTCQWEKGLYWPSNKHHRQDNRVNARERSGHCKQ